ncbi:glycosyltransferase family 39 protein [Synechocystis sp. PCC 7509]|uniref:glycosyltransferase family 39 protein n=1 Tax=Synechocystis sp. PCC 7509 TaxID=927677 RepID=UPI0002ABFCAC|nr:glycosyltransferase family 39 protein [Synechocystis sp. PCC 7509]
MVTKIKKYHLGILLLLWLVIAIVDILWLKCDRSIPSWDQADYLTGTLNYHQALQNPQWFDSRWWRSFWLLSSKIPPFTYMAAATIQQIFGTGQDQAMLVNVLFNGILIVAVYGLGVELFSVEVGLGAALLCQIFPAFYQLRLDFLLDFPLTAAVTLSYWCLTVWRGRKTQNWWWAAFGVALGVALLVKQTAIFFLLIPIIWVGVETIKSRLWGRLLQLVGALLVSFLVCGAWYRVNWLFVLTTGKRATIDSAIAENDPALNTIGAWTYYWQVLPIQVSWLLLIVPIVGLLMGWRFRKTPQDSFKWLAVFWVGAYFLWSVNVNKDSRYVLPYLPVVALFLAYGLTSWRGRWQKPIRVVTVGLAALLMIFNLFPLGGKWIEVLSPYGQHYADFKTNLPHRQVIAEIRQTEPYLRSTVGVLPSTAQINQHNFNYFGALEHFQVYARQVGTRKNQVRQDGRSIDWFLTKTGDQGSISDTQTLIAKEVETSPELQLQKSWRLPDNSSLQLYHRRLPKVKVEPMGAKIDKVELQVTVPSSAPPGVTIPVTYQWSGDWKKLKSGLVLLNWHQINTNQISWLNDRAIGLGNLYSLIDSDNSFKVTETSAMLPPKNTPPGIYTLTATYLNKDSGESYLLPSLPVSLEINPLSAPTAAPELDLITQLQVLAATLSQGTPALEHLFAEVARINQYDPTQDYLQQIILAMQYRLKSPQKDPHWAYALALAAALKRDVNGAIAAFEQVTNLDSQNPYAYAYLAFVRLYNFQPYLAEKAVLKAISLNSKLPELHALHTIAALMQGKLFPAWDYFQQYKANTANLGSALK